MTDEERAEAERIAKIFLLNENEGESRESELKCLARSAYKAGRESMRAERDQTFEHLHQQYRFRLKDAEAERERAAKLVEALKSLRSKCASLNAQCANAIGEYEVNRDQ